MTYLPTYGQSRQVARASQRRAAFADLSPDAVAALEPILDRLTKLNNSGKYHLGEDGCQELLTALVVGGYLQILVDREKLRCGVSTANTGKQ